MEGCNEAILLASLQAFCESHDFLHKRRHILFYGLRPFAYSGVPLAG